jgi:hypothetical protein
MIETAIKYLVCPSSTTIPAIATRLYVGTLPDIVTYPCAIMYSISRTEDMYESNIRTERFQFSCYAETLSSATSIADSIKDRIKRYYGQPSTAYAYRIISAWFDNLTFLYDDSVLKYVRILDMKIRYKEV